MDWNERVRQAFTAAGPVPDEDVIEELAQHASAEYEACRADQAPADEALRRVEQHVAAWVRDPALRRPRKRHRAAVVPPPSSSSSRLAAAWTDLRYAARLMRRQPGHSLVAILTMALGIGATTVLFSVAYGVLLKPLPWPGADRLVRLTESRDGRTSPAGPIVTNATYLAWRESSATLDGLAGWAPQTVTIAGEGAPERADVAAVSASLFPLLSAEPLLGRLFTEEQETARQDVPVILSHPLWQRRFGGSPAALGQALRIDGVPHRIAAVMPAAFVFPDRDTQAWVPLRVPPATKNSLAMFRAIGRLKPGATADQAASEGTSRGRHAQSPSMVAMAVFGSNGPVDVAAVPWIYAETASVRPALLVFLAAVGLLLVTATGNIASLQLARATGRRREVAIRAALGAGRGRLMQQFLAESVLLGLAGGLCGMVLASWLQLALPRLLPPSFPRANDIEMNLPVAAAAIGLAVLASLVFGLLPALQARRLNVAASINEDGRAPIGGGFRSPVAAARSLIIAGQVAVACVLLVGAALLGRSFLALVSADRGYDPSNVLTANLPLPEASYDGPRRVEIADAVLARLRAVPGVREAGLTTRLPFGGGDVMMGFQLPSLTGEGMVTVHAVGRYVSAGYFKALGLRVAAGRAFTDQDGPAARPVVVVNRAFARQYLREPAVGRLVPLDFSAVAPEAEVVGVIDDVRQQGMNDPVRPELYMPYRQLDGGILFETLTLVVRTSGSPTGLVPELRRIVGEQDRSLALDRVATMEDRLRTHLAEPRLYAVLLGGFAVFALAIAGVGLFGVLAYSVAQRSREIGIRTALGARPRDVVALVVRQGLAMTAGGVIAGLVVSTAAVRWLSGLLYGVAPYDTATFLVVPIALLAVAAVACIVPARRAAGVDPLRVLRA